MTFSLFFSIIKEKERKEKMSRKRNFYLILDTETTGSIQNPIPYDIAWMICDREGNTVDKKQFVINNVFYNNYLMMGCYFSDRLNYYENNTRVEFIDAENFFPFFRKTIIDFEITHLCAYNLNFDVRALTTLNRMYGKTKKVLPKPLELVDIWSMACFLFLDSVSYRLYCRENGFLSEKGNYRSNAECAYRFIMRDSEFEELHNALDDVEIEKQILLYCFSRKTKLPKENIANPWRLIQKKDEFTVKSQISFDFTKKAKKERRK